jgi:uncharacterized protein YdeI (YjbR/CyaY-like superfamily)
MKSYPNVDAYLAEAIAWRDEMAALREIALSAEVEEAVKWGKPCYIGGGGNIAIMQPFKDFLSFMFFKGALLKDSEGVLREQGENTRSAKRMEFRSVDEIEAAADILRDYLAEAVAREKSGAKVDFDENRELEPPDELVDALDSDPDLATAWKALTPGRQRGYVLHIAGAKKSETRAARIEKHRERIMAGKGLNDR